MLFYSFPFAAFFIVVFLLYYLPLREKTNLQNWLLLTASYFFYGFANWRIIPILLSVTTIFYFLGIAINKANNGNKSSLYRTLGVILGVSILLYFKYLNFFIESFGTLFQTIGVNTDWNTLNIIMPIGVSFFTFKVISYTIEIYRGRMLPCKDFITFSTYVAFFPTIMAGPIDRPDKFIPQLQNKRIFQYDDTVEGIQRFLWGLFKKLCVADRLGLYVDAVYGNYTHHNGTTLSLTAVLFAFQIYADFSGYSDMAIGIGKILGFKVMENFNRPFFATNIAEFWRRMHISLTTWVTDYVFMPLNVKFRTLGKSGVILALIINMIIIGLWHGANWTYAVFGLYQGLLFIPLIVSGSFFKNKKRKQTTSGIPTITDLRKMLGTFILIIFSLIIFRANSVTDAFEIIKKIFTEHGALFQDYSVFMLGGLSLLIMMVKDYNDEFNIRLNFLHSKYTFVKGISVIGIIAYILFMGVLDAGQFIYFQF